MPRQPKEPNQPRRKKSTYGGGTIYPRKDGRYVASITDPNTGKRIERYAKSQKEAEKKLEDIKYEIRQGTLATGPHQTVKQFLEGWFEEVHKLEVRETTYYHHCIILNKHLLPALGHLQLQKLTPLHIRRLYADKLKEGLKPGRIYSIHSALHNALRDAVRWRLVSYNVCDQVSPPQEEEFEGQALTIEQIVQLLKGSLGHPLEALIALALTGMRHGEIIGLRWSDIDFNERCLRIERTVTRLGRQGYVEGKPKAKKSKREVMLPLFVIEALNRHRARQQEMKAKAGER